MYNLFYHPAEEVAAAADFIPFYDNGVFHLFYLYDHRNNEKYGEGISWNKITTTDFINFTDNGVMIKKGGKTDLDLCAFTGSVIKAFNKYHIFYTGHNVHIGKDGNQIECIMHAESEDLAHWTKIPQDTFYAPSGYETENFRDPFVYFEDKSNTYCMLICARPINGPTLRKGETIKMKSTDLHLWKFSSKFYAPESFHTHECPDLFSIGKWYYLIFSEYSDKSVTCYRMSKSANGPWIKPKNDTFDGRAFYAAKTASDSKNRYLFGWTPTRQQNKDNGDWMWGGNLVVHKLLQNKDGTLSVTIPDTINNAFINAFKIENCTLKGFDKTSIRTLFSQKDCFKLSFTAEAEKNSRSFGVLVKRNSQADDAYAFLFDLSKNELTINRHPCFPQNNFATYQLCRPIKTSKKYNVKLIADNDVFVMYINNETALCVRLCNLPKGEVAIFAENSTVKFTNISIEKLKF